MRYADAFKIGSKIEGYIKCTYAEVHSPEFGLLFSLQRTGMTRNQAIQAIGYENPNVDEEFHFGTEKYEVDIPIVEADKFAGDSEKVVPVKLTKLAVMMIKRKITGKYAKNANTLYHHPKYEELLKRMDENSVFYVKQVAIDWYPTDIENAVIENDGVEIKLSDALEKAKQRYENAKAILATAGALAIM